MLQIDTVPVDRLPALFLAGYTASIFGGWLIAGTCVYVMRLSIGYPRRFFRWLDLWVGGTERAVATTLTIWCPHLLPAFVGGWVVIKLALNWQRQNTEGVQRISLVALVGSVVSFAVAIGVALMLHPSSLDDLSK